VADRLVMSAILRAYNCCLAEFCRADSSRLKGIAMINLDDVEDGIRELERAASLRLAAAMITEYPLEDRRYEGYQLLAQASQRPRLGRLGYRQRAHPIAEVVSERIGDPREGRRHDLRRRVGRHEHEIVRNDQGRAIRRDYRDCGGGQCWRGDNHDSTVDDDHKRLGSILQPG
jgi:hypothetical protein